MACPEPDDNGRRERQAGKQPESRHASASRQACRSRSRPPHFHRQQCQPVSRWSTAAAQIILRCGELPEGHGGFVHSPISHISRATASEEIAEQRPDADADGDGLIGMFHARPGRPPWRLRRLWRGTRPAFPWRFPARRRSRLRASPTFSRADIRSGGREGAGVFSELPHVVTMACVSLFILFGFYLVMFFSR